MSAIIYYFSATGNSLHAAKTIAACLENCTIASIPALVGANEVRANAADVGIVFPLHCFGIPPLIDKFMEKLNLDGAEYIFAVVTCGDPHISGALHQLDNLLAAKGKSLDAGFRVKMVSNYLPLSALPPENKREKLLRQADERLAAIAALATARTKTKDAEYLRLPSMFINKQWKKQVAGRDSNFTCAETCVACGLCQKICPVGNITLDAGKPRWNHNCLECQACLHCCPTQSINFGSRTKNRQRYLHPRISIDEILAQMVKPK